MNNNPEYQEVTETIDIPKHAGIEGFIAALRGVLRMPRVVSINIDARGKVAYTRYARREEPRKNIEIDFESVSPSAIIRNGHVIEIDVEDRSDNASICLALMFARAAADHMYPVAWVVGGNSRLWQWHEETTAVALPDASAFALPVFRDRHIPDEALLLACAYGPNAALIDAQTAYKITIPNPVPWEKLEQRMQGDEVPPDDAVKDVTS